MPHPLSTVPSYRLQNQQTQEILAGYQVLCATETEIGHANTRLAQQQMPLRFVLDFEAPVHAAPQRRTQERQTQAHS